MLWLSWVIKYPEVVHCRVVLTTLNPPIRVMADASGRVQQLFVAEKEAVVPGQMLAVFESTAHWQDVLRLETWLAAPHEPAEMPPGQLVLGDLQPNYSDFNQHWQDFRYFEETRDGGSQQKISDLRRQIAQFGRLNENLRRQRDIFREEFVLAEKDRVRNQKLRNEKLISEADFEKSQAERLQQKRQSEQATASILQNGMQVQQMEAQITDLQQFAKDSQNGKQLTISEDIARLQSAIADWKKRFLIVAPVAGRASLSKIWASGQPIAAGDEVLAIVPQNGSGAALPVVVAKAEIPASEVEKIKVGMLSVIQLDGFTAQQTGSVEGAVLDVALIPQKETYSVSLKIDWPIVSNQGKAIPFRAEMGGEGRVFCSEKRVIDRMAERVFSMLYDR